HGISGPGHGLGGVAVAAISLARDALGTGAAGPQRVGDSGGGRQGRPRALARRRRWSSAESLQLLEDGIGGLALAALHGIEEHPPVLPDLVDRDDISVVQPGRGPRFAAEPLLAAGVLAEGGREDLQGDVPAQRELLGLVDDPHAAPAHLAEDAVARDPLRPLPAPA